MKEGNDKKVNGATDRKPRAARHEPIHLRSEEVQELMGEIPPLVQRVGITVIFVIVIALLAVCAFMKCPEKVVDGKVIYSNQTILERMLEKRR